jgi:hypothetical protein
MKTYTITCHNVYNYGASLQAFALQKFLLSRGIDNKIIDYLPDYLSWHYHFRWWISPRGSHYGLLKKCAPLRFCYVIRRYLRDMMSVNRKQAFDSFLENNMSLTQRCTTIDEINKCVADADILIAGSDQIWNSYSLENGLDGAFYLDFGPREAKRISYAASFGVNILKEKDKTFVKNMLAHFNLISVREEKGKELISTFGYNADVVLDPVFLLDKSEWNTLASSSIPSNPYVLIYAIGGMSDRMSQMVKQIERDGSYEILCIRSNRSVEGLKEIKTAGPVEFVSLIKSASCILSNSFHATAFSIIFEKPFYTFSYGEAKTSERLLNLLSITSLLTRYNCETFDIHKTVNYDDVRIQLQTYINKASQWIENATKV